MACEGIRHPQQLLRFPTIGKSASIVESADFWYTNQHSSGCQVIPFLCSPDAWMTNCSPGSSWKYLLPLCSITGISYTHRAHHTHTSHSCRDHWATRSKVRNARSIHLFISRKGFLLRECSLNKTAKGSE